MHALNIKLPNKFCANNNNTMVTFWKHESSSLVVLPSGICTTKQHSQFPYTRSSYNFSMSLIVVALFLAVTEDHRQK